MDGDACQLVVNKAIKEQAWTNDNVRPESGPQKSLIPFDQYYVAAPCTANWDGMEGTATFRLCQECKAHVYDFRKMDLGEAKALVFQREGKTNNSFYKRRDGKFLTANCKVGVKRRRLQIYLGIATFCGVILITIVLIVILIVVRHRH